MSPDRRMLNSNSDAFNEAVDYSNYKANKELIMKAKQQFSKKHEIVIPKSIPLIK